MKYEVKKRTIKKHIEKVKSNKIRINPIISMLNLNGKQSDLIKKVKINCQKQVVYCFIVKPKIPNFIETRYLFYVGQTTRPFQERFQEISNDKKERETKT